LIKAELKHEGKYIGQSARYRFVDLMRNCGIKAFNYAKAQTWKQPSESLGHPPSRVFVATIGSHLI
jgi:hypothetical protein